MRLITLLLFSTSLSSHAFTLIGNQKGWNTKTLSVHLNPSNCPADIFSRLDESFKLWNSVPSSSLKLELGNSASAVTTAQLNAGTASEIPVVICETQFTTAVSANANSVAGVGFGSGSDPKGHITYGGLILNVQPGASASINNMTETQRSIVIAHELGHMLGLGHSSSAPALMYYSVGVKQHFNLSKDDWDGISYLYPRDEIGQTNLAAGCGMVKTGRIPMNTRNGTLFLLILPLLYFFYLKIRLQRQNPRT